MGQQTTGLLLVLLFLFFPSLCICMNCSELFPRFLIFRLWFCHQIYVKQLFEVIIFSRQSIQHWILWCLNKFVEMKWSIFWFNTIERPSLVMFIEKIQWKYSKPLGIWHLMFWVKHKRGKRAYKCILTGI